MRVLLAANALYAPPKGGSTRSNLVWLDALAARGHECRVVCAAPAENVHDDVVARGTIAIRRVAGFTRNHHVLEQEIQDFTPDWVLVSSEDLSHVLLREAGRAAADRLVYLAHTPQWFPFGPESWHTDTGASDIVRRARAVVVIGDHMAQYVREHAGVEARVVHPPMYGSPPYENFAKFDRGAVLMVNPCAVKGVAIFAGLAERFPSLPFEALAGWGTTADDRARLGSIANVQLIETVPRIEDALRRARVLLMPSLWYEGFGLIAMEAMLRGLPVLASYWGGLIDAKRGTGYRIPVRPVRRYLAEFDETHMPVPVIEPQDLGPWAAALRVLTQDRGAYEMESRLSRVVAERFVGGLRAEALGEMLESLEHGSGAPAGLSLAKRQLLLRRLREKAGR